MAERPQFTGPIAQIRPIPSIRLSTGALQVLDTLSTEAFKHSLKIEERLDTEAAITAKRRALIDGNNGELNKGLLWSSTVAGRAYTETAIAEFEKFQQINMQSRLQEIANEHPLDPGGFDNGVATYAKEFLSNQNMPEELKGRLGMALQTMARPISNDLNEDLIASRQNMAAAQLKVREAQMQLMLQRYAGGILNNNPQASSDALNAVMLLRTQIDQSYKTTIKDAKGREFPAFSPDKRIEALAEFDKVMTEHAVKGWFLKQPNKIEALKMWGRGEMKTAVVDEKGEQLFIFDPVAGNNQYTLDGDGIISMTDWMRNQISSEISLEDKLIARSDRAKRLADDNTMVQILNEADPDMRSTMLESLRVMTEDPQTVEWANTYEKTFGDLGLTDPQTLRMTLEGIQNNAIQDPHQLPGEGLSFQDHTELSKLLLSRKKGAHITNQPDYKAAVDFIWKTIAGESKGESRFSFNATAEKQRQRDEANRLESLLLEQAMTVTRQLDAEGKTTAFDPWSTMEGLMDERDQRLEAREKQAALLSDKRAELEALRVEKRQRGENPDNDPTYKRLQDQYLKLKRSMPR